MRHQIGNVLFRSISLNYSRHISNAFNVSQHLIQQTMRDMNASVYRIISDNTSVKGNVYLINKYGLESVLQRRERKLNREKCNFQMNELKFMAHEISHCDGGESTEKSKC